MNSEKDMKTVPLGRDTRGFCSRILEDLISSGWIITKVPSDAKIPRNQLLLRLRNSGTSIAVRILVYKVTTSGRQKIHERRVEITSTYEGFLQKKEDYLDVVLGYDVESNRYIGIDKTRLLIGGPTHNASSFFDKNGLSCNLRALTISPRAANASIFPSGIEYHAFFGRRRLSDYILNHQKIHAGRYFTTTAGRGIFKTRVLPKIFDQRIADGECFELTQNTIPSNEIVREQDLISYENGDFSARNKRKITPEELRRIQDTCSAIGNLGEQLVIEEERKRLHVLGKVRAAEKIVHTSLASVSEGYDILSFEDDGKTKKYIEVKTTVGSGNFIDISAGEWKVAQQLGPQYYIARVKSIRKNPSVKYYRNPFDSVVEHSIKKTPTGWRIDLSHFE